MYIEEEQNRSMQDLRNQIYNLKEGFENQKRETQLDMAIKEEDLHNQVNC